MDSSSSSENYDISSFTSSSFASKDDLTSYSSSTKINFDPSIFENHLSAITSDIEPVNSADCKDSLSDKKLEDPRINIEFEPFITTHAEDTIFSYDLTNYFFSRK